MFCTGRRPAPFWNTSGERCLVETDEPNRCRVTYFVPERHREEREVRTRRKQKRARGWAACRRHTYWCGPSSLLALRPSSEAPNYEALTHLHGHVWSKLHSKPHQIRIICECKRLSPSPPPSRRAVFPRVLAASSAGAHVQMMKRGFTVFLTFSRDLRSVPLRRLRATGVTHNYPKIWSATPPPAPTTKLERASSDWFDVQAAH